VISDQRANDSSWRPDGFGEPDRRLADSTDQVAEPRAVSLAWGVKVLPGCARSRRSAGTHPARWRDQATCLREQFPDVVMTIESMVEEAEVPMQGA
jgi:hypothetical protein